MNRLLLPAAALVTLCVPVTEAYAQLIGTYRIRAGIGAQVSPEYLGSGDYEVGPKPVFSIAKGDEPFGFGAADDSLGIALLSGGGFSAGPALALRSGRNNSDTDLPLREFGRSVEAGAFVQHEVSDSFRLRAELRKGIGGHGGLNGHAGADYVWRDGDRYLFSIGPRVRFSDARFQRAYFGISPEESLAAGLPAYRPSGGIHAVGAISSMNVAIAPRWGLFGFARYDRLIGDSRKSPIVRDIGSPDQFYAGIGVTHTFTLKL